MIGYVSEQSTPFSTILEFFNPMHQANPAAFLRALLRRQSYSWLADYVEDEALLTAVAERVMQSYDAAALRAAIISERNGPLSYGLKGGLATKLKSLLGMS